MTADALKSVDAHLADILAAVRPLAPVELPLLDASGCVLTEDVTAPFPLPGFDNSAMDGYAVVAADVAGATPARPVTLPVVGDIAAGPAPDLVVRPGTCVRIMTGAPLPPGADAVVQQEWTDAGTTIVAVRRPPVPGQHIRRAGSDAPAGTVVVRAGTVLGPNHLGVAAATGHARVPARPRPRVVVISTGSELVEPGRPMAPGQLPDSNSVALTLAAREAGATAVRVGIVPDDPRRLTEVLTEQLASADAVVTSGGVSVGAFDVVKEVLAEVGTVRFERVAMQPGMPQGFGTIGPAATPFFGLPGNPVSAYVSFEVFVRPALLTMWGMQPVQRPTVMATLTAPLRSPAGKRQFARGRLAAGHDGERLVTPVGGPGSHLLVSLADAGALIVLPEDVVEVAAGTPVATLALDRWTP